MPVRTQPSPPAPTPSPHLGRWQYITSRADDPVALTLTELFPAQVSAGPRSYLRTEQRADHSCRSAVFGSRLAAAVHRGCSQALRASYLSANGKRMGTIGVLNLATASAAAKAGKAVTAPRQFIQALPGLHGATRKLGMGTGVVWALTKGHYLILMWAAVCEPAHSRHVAGPQGSPASCQRSLPGNRQPEPDPADGDGETPAVLSIEGAASIESAASGDSGSDQGCPGRRPRYGNLWIQRCQSGRICQQAWR